MKQGKSKWLSHRHQILALNCRMRGFKHAGGGAFILFGDLKKVQGVKETQATVVQAGKKSVCVGKEINMLQF